MAKTPTLSSIGPIDSLSFTFTYGADAFATSTQIDNNSAVPLGTFDNLHFTIVPEPASAAVLGLLGVAGLRRRR